MHSGPTDIDTDVERHFTRHFMNESRYVTDLHMSPEDQLEYTAPTGFRFLDEPMFCFSTLNANVLYHTRIYTIRVWYIPYAYTHMV